jgi:hypothetical protein
MSSMTYLMQYRKLSRAALAIPARDERQLARSQVVIQDDVFMRLLTFPNVIVTAHQGSFTREALHNIAETTLANVTAFESGRGELNVVGQRREALRGSPHHPETFERLHKSANVPTERTEPTAPRYRAGQSSSHLWFLGVDRQQTKHIDVSRAKRTEVPLVQGRELWLAEPFHDGEHCGIDEAYVRVGEAVADLPNTQVVRRRQRLHAVGTRDDVVQEGDQDAGAEPSVNPVVQLDEDRLRNHEGFVCELDQLPTCPVVGVAPVQGSVDRTRIEDQRQVRVPARSSRELRATSDRPEAPTPRLLGFGR